MKDYARSVSGTALLSREEEQELAQRWRERGDRAAAERLVASHLRLVRSIARRYTANGISLEDLVSEGTVGLILAVQRFDPDQGTRLSTYARWWIRASIQEAVIRSWSLVKLGTRAPEKRLFFHLRARGRGLEQSDGDIAALAKDLGADVEDLLALHGRVLARDASLDAAFQTGEGELLPRLNLVEEEGPGPEEQVEQQQAAALRRKVLSEAVRALDARERRIIEARRLDDRSVTLAELSREFGVSRERVRQLESRAIGKMRKTITAQVREEGYMLNTLLAPS